MFFLNLCRWNPDYSVIQVANYYNVPVSEASLKSIVASSGPVSVAIDARGDFQLYKSGNSKMVLHMGI